MAERIRCGPMLCTVAVLLIPAATGGKTSHELAMQATAASGSAPGAGAWANYDFVPGERVLFAEDFTEDTVGDFPKRLALKHGNWEVIEWEGHRLLRNTGPRYSAVEVQLPENLPERFTIEIDVYLANPTYQLVVATDTPKPSVARMGANYFSIGRAGTGVAFGGSGGVVSRSAEARMMKAVTPIRIMVDGQYAKVYVDERRVANVPNVQLPRTRVIHFQNTYSASERSPLLIGAIRVAAGGRDLYDVLEAEGRVATQGIYFATDSDRLRPESTPTLKSIGEMLKTHPELALTIEGHTDNQGDAASNQALSERRAAAVRTHLVQSFGIDGARLDATGFGQSRPAAPNDTPEGRQQNRRVELVKRGG